MRTSKDVRYLVDKSEAPEIIKGVNELVDEHNFLAKNLSFTSNFNGQIIENIVFTAGETKTIPHALGIKPKYRIIMGQVGNGVLDDIPFGWNNFSVQMKNNGAVSVTATIFLVRE